MPLPPQCRYKTCLGCIPLQEGCIVLGCTGMVGSLLELVNHIRVLVDFELSVNQCRQREISGNSDGREGGFMLSMMEDLENDEERKKKCPSDSIVNFARFVFGFSSFSYFVYFITAAMMIYGVRKKIPRMMTPWMVWEVAQIFFNIIILLGLGYRRTPFGISSLLEIVLMVYFILVVTSYYVELKEAEERHGGITVMAVTQTPHEMTVVIPTAHPKEDPPPPYPGFNCAYYPGYDPTGAGLPMYSHTMDSPPPAYEASIPISPQQNQASSIPIPHNPTIYVNPNTRTHMPSGRDEAAPLVEKPPLPNN